MTSAACSAILRQIYSSKNLLWDYTANIHAAQQKANAEKNLTVI